MLRVNQLSGFGGGNGGPSLTFLNGSTTNTNNPAWSIDLGPPGPKQVLVAFACFGSVGNDPWTWGTGSIGGESFTYSTGGGQEVAGNGGTSTGGATIRTIQTLLGGPQTLTISNDGYGGTMLNHCFLAAVTRGFNPTPLSADNGDNQSAFPSGRDCVLNTSGARLILVSTMAYLSTPGSLQGPGSEVTVVSETRIAAGYDLSPAGGGSDIYSFTGTTYLIAGAAFA